MQKKKLSANEFLRVSSYLISTTLSLPKALKPQFASWPCINQPTPTLPPYCSSARAKNSEALRFRCLETCCKNDDKITVCFLSSYSFLSFKWEIKHTLLSMYKAVFTQRRNRRTNSPCLIHCISPSPWMRNCTCLDAKCKAIHGPFGQRSHVKKLQKLKVLWKAVGWTPNSKPWFLMGLVSLVISKWLMNKPCFFQGPRVFRQKNSHLCVFSAWEKQQHHASYHLALPWTAKHALFSQNSIRHGKGQLLRLTCAHVILGVVQKVFETIYVIILQISSYIWPVDKTYKHIFPWNNQHILMFDL